VLRRFWRAAVVQAMLLLEADLARSWTLTSLAAELHLAPGYLVRLFNAATGLPPMPYLGQLRAEHAAVLLLHSDEPVTSIGRAVGWSASAQALTVSASPPEPYNFTTPPRQPPDARRRAGRSAVGSAVDPALHMLGGSAPRERRPGRSPPRSQASGMARP
jgi:AraC-like DNA-binding protein